MPRPIQTGLNTVSRKGPDGKVVRRYYHRESGLFLGNDRLQAIEKAAEMDGRAVPKPLTTFYGLATAYLGSTRFTDLRPKVQKLNRLYVDQLRDRYGDLPVTAITRPVVVTLGETLAKRPYHCARTLATLRLVLAYGKDLGVLKANPAERPGGATPPKRITIWSDDQIDRMLTAARPEVRLACALMLYTAQRPGDVLGLKWSQIRERNGRLWLSLSQEKTSELIDIPLHSRVAEIVASTNARGSLLVASPTGLPWAYRNFSRAWDRARARADYRLAREMFAAGHKKEEIRPHLLKGLQRRDLRRTAMVQMAVAGATDAQIAAVSGHTIEQTRRILDVYIPRRGEVAQGAIAAWEKAGGGGRVFLLPKRRVEKRG